MAAPMIGTMSEYSHGKEDWSSYQKRLEIWMKANKVKKEDRATIFLATVGPTAFELLISLFAPDDISDVTYEVLTDELSKYYKPVRNVIWERQMFTERKQNVGESVMDFILELKRLSKHCEFGMTYQDRLRDRFVGGVRGVALQRKLLSEKNLTFEKACEIAIAMEIAEKDVLAFKSDSCEHSGKVNQVKRQEKHKTFRPCYRCTKTNHHPDDCYFRKKTCLDCGKVGHIVKACQDKQSKHTQNKNQGYRKKFGNKSRGRAHLVAEESGEESDEEEEYDRLLAIYSTQGGKENGYKVPLQLEGKSVEFFLDTAASHSVIGEKMFKRHLSKLKLKPTKVSLLDYSDNIIPLLGEVIVNIKLEDREYSLPLVVAEGRRVPLFGRNCISQVQLNWGKLCAISEKSLSDELKKSYPSVFEGKGVIKTFKADIKVQPNVNPKFCKSRPVPYALREAVETELDRLEKEGIIQKVEKADWATPIVVVPKANKRVRLCGDFKVTVNPVLEENIYPLPTAEDLFAKMGGATLFSKLDLSSAYLQLELTDRSKPLLVINTHKGLYEFQRLCFGISTAPSIFQSVMDQVLQGIPHVECLLDDILIGTVTEKQHDDILHQVLKRLDTYGIKVNLDKCKFKVHSVDYLGHHIDRNGLHPMKEKIQAITEAPSPKNITELRAFLGMLNYYSRFLGNMSTLLAPLYHLLKADTAWSWTAEQETVFQKCKTLLSSESVLVHYDMNKPLILACDASAYGVGCVLSHQMDDGSERPIAYASRTLSPSEKNYAQLEKEALAIVYGIKKFHKYIYGRKFTLITDHKPLTTILGPKTGVPTLAAARLQRWALILMAHTYEIRYRRSEDHGNADGLSRLPGKDDPETIEGQVNYFTNVDNLPVTASEVAKATRKDPVLSRVLDHTLRGWPNYVTDEGLKPYFQRRHEISVDQDCILWGMRVVIPPVLQDNVLQELHADHPGMVKMKARARSYLWYPGMDKDIEMTVKSCTVCETTQRDPPTAPLQPWSYPQRVWERIHVNFAEYKGHNYFVLIDSRSKWIEVKEMKSTTAEKTVETLRTIFSSYGLPEELVSDNGPQFTAEVFETFLAQNGVKHSLTPPYHPASNGAAERSVQIIKAALKKHFISQKIGGDNTSVKKHLSNFLLTYRSTPHSVTGRTPAELFLGRQVCTRLSLLKPDLNKKVEEAQQKQKDFHDNQNSLREFQPNDHVGFATTEREWQNDGYRDE